MNIAEFNEICLLVCKHCASGKQPRQRQNTGEWVHDWTEKGRAGATIYHHSICGASGFRNSRFAKEAASG